MANYTWQQIVEFQSKAHSRIHTKSGTPTEIAAYKRYLIPSKLADIALPQIPLVKVTDDHQVSLPKELEKLKDKNFILLGEVNQIGGAVVFDVDNGKYHYFKKEHFHFIELTMPVDF